MSAYMYKSPPVPRVIYPGSFEEQSEKWYLLHQELGKKFARRLRALRHRPELHPALIAFVEEYARELEHPQRATGIVSMNMTLSDARDVLATLIEAMEEHQELARKLVNFEEVP